MRFCNRTGWPVSIRLVEIDTDTLVTGVGIIAPNRDMERPIERLDDKGTVVFSAEGTLNIVQSPQTTVAEEMVYAVDLSSTAIHPLADGFGFKIEALPLPKAGDPFRHLAPAPINIENIRAQVKSVYGRDVHISVMVGPGVRDGAACRFAIKAIDDEVLTGDYRGVPLEIGYAALIGHFV